MGTDLPCSLRLLGAGGPEDVAPVGIMSVSVIRMTYQITVLGSFLIMEAF